MLNLRYGAAFDIELWKRHLLPFAIIYVLWLIIFYISGLYDLSLARNNLKFYATLFRSLAIGAIIAIGFFYIIPYFTITPKTNLFLNILVFLILFSIWRQLFNISIRATTLLNNVLIIGQTKETKELAQTIKAHPQLGYYLKKMVDYQKVKIIFDLIDIIIKEKIQTIVTTVDPHRDKNLMRNLYHCLPLKVTLNDLPTFYERVTGKVPVSAIEEIWFLENLMNKEKGVYEAIKRMLDMLGAIVLLILTLPLYPLIALVIRLDSPGPIFYKQKRVSQDGKIFWIHKFRTMIKDAEKDGVQWAKPKDARITKVGYFLRKSRIDELPQLLNVLKGEMSFIGPRPERPEFVFGKNSIERQIPFYQIRHLVRPGLTGWAQINFEYGSSLEDTLEKLQYDLYYLKSRSFLLDLSILLKTIKIVLRRSGR